jgi:prevent-host-death family protein
MDVAVSELRAHLGDWLDRARAGDDVVVTERGVPVARLVGLSTTTGIERLTERGVISKPSAPRRPTARGRARPRARGSVADLVGEQRR